MTKSTAATSAAAREAEFIDLIVQVAHADMKRVASALVGTAKMGRATASVAVPRRPSR